MSASKTKINQTGGVLSYIQNRITEQLNHDQGSKAVIDNLQLEKFLKSDPFISATNELGQTALHLAVMWCDSVTVQRLLDAGLNPEQPDYSGMTPVHCCGLLGSLEVFQCLPDNTWDLREETSGRSVLHFAGISGNMDIICHIVESGGDINTVDEFGQSPVVTSVLYSQPKVAAYLIEQGAQLDLRDKVGVPAVVVVNAKYPGLAANMLDRFVEHVEYEDQLKVDLSFMLTTGTPHPDTEVGNYKDPKSINITPYETLVVMSSNITDHVTVRCMTDAKWNLYGGRLFYIRFFAYLFFALFWTIFYALVPDKMSTWDGRRGLAYFFMIFGVLLLAVSFVNVIYSIRKNMEQGASLMGMIKAREAFESSTHNHLTAQYGGNVSKGRSQIKNKIKKLRSFAVSNFIRVLIHFILLAHCILKGLSLIDGKELQGETGRIVMSVAAAIVLLFMWGWLFFQCEVHSSLGKFVVFIRETNTDVCLVLGVFVFMYIPNLAIFYYTVYRYDDKATWHDIVFNVLRMSVVDYDYDVGKELTQPENLDWWWNFYVCFWILLTAVVVINLFIALMSDRYAELGSRARAIVALSRAELISEVDMLIPRSWLAQYNSQLLESAKEHGGIEVVASEQETTVQSKIETLEAKIDSLIRLVGDLQKTKAWD